MNCICITHHVNVVMHYVCIVLCIMYKDNIVWIVSCFMCELYCVFCITTTSCELCMYYAVCELYCVLCVNCIMYYVCIVLCIMYKDNIVWIGFETGTGWRRLIGSPKLQIIFHQRATKYRALLRKMTYKDKGSYESSPPCTTTCMYMFLKTCMCMYPISNSLSLFTRYYLYKNSLDIIFIKIRSILF